MRKTNRAIEAGVGVALAAVVSAGTADAQSQVEVLREQLRVLEKRINELEAKEAENSEKIEETANTVESKVIKHGGGLGTFVIPGIDTRVSIGGYVKGDFIYDAIGDIGADDLFVPTTISTSGEDDRRFTAHARESRLAVRTTTPSSFGPIKTLFEGDFFGVGPSSGAEVQTNSFSFRIRHLYGEVGPVGAGQFWTNFMPIQAFPRTVDFQGAAGIPFIRQGQLRLTLPVTDKFTFIGTLENSEFSGRAVDAGDADDDGDIAELLPFGDTAGGALGGLDVGLDVAPDAVLTGIYRDDFGLVRGSVVGRRFGGQNGGDGTFGWGVNAAANLNLWPGGKLLASVTYGDGVGRYIINGPGLDGVIDANGNVSSIASFGGTVQLQQKLTDDVTLGLTYGRFDVFDAFADNDIESLNTVHGSLFWSPFDRVTFGAEAIFGTLTQADGDDGNALRFQTTVRLDF